MGTYGRDNMASVLLLAVFCLSSCTGMHTGFSGVSNGEFTTVEGSEDTKVPVRITTLTQSQPTSLPDWTISSGAVYRLDEEKEAVGRKAWGYGSSLGRGGGHILAIMTLYGTKISTNLNGMDVGAMYTVSWYERGNGRADRPDLRGRSLEVRIGSCSGDTLMASHVVPDDWEQRAAVFKAPSSATTLCFIIPMDLNSKSFATWPSGESPWPNGVVFLDGIKATYLH